jgi:hypothetical protein
MIYQGLEGERDFQVLPYLQSGQMLTLVWNFDELHLKISFNVTRIKNPRELGIV